MKDWNKLSNKEIRNHVFEALNKNTNYVTEEVLGLPASYLDEEQFYQDAPMLKDAPFLSALVANPNHIGCHTTGKSEPVFKGTHQIEKELIKICAENIFNGEIDQQDGYVASGGTEANLEAMWIYRNYFAKERNAKTSEIATLFSEDSHYSMYKGVDLLGINAIIAEVDFESRVVDVEKLEQQLKQQKKAGIKYIILVVNMSSTMFGSVDNLMPYITVLTELEFDFKVHVDAAFGGFIYPFTNPDNELNFANKYVTSITIDGHKMLQSPYGTGIFLIRKGYINYVTNSNAQYVPGLDYTIVGSRSGANAVAVWMILMNHGAIGIKARMNKLINHTDDICDKLDDMNIRYFRNKFINIIAIQAEDISDKIALKYRLVADSYENKVKWWKIVVMAHVKRGSIDNFINEVKNEKIMLKC